MGGIRPKSSLLIVSLLIAACSEEEIQQTTGEGVPVNDAAVDTAPALAPDELLNGCMIASACGVQTYPILSNCLAAYYKIYRVHGLAPIYDEIYKCVIASKGVCTAVADCFGRGPACDASYKATCSGKVAVSCDLIDKRVYKLDCADAGMECQLPSGQTAMTSCTPGSCSSTFVGSCSGNVLLSCSAGIKELHDCSVEGQLCGSAGKGTVACIGESKEKCFSQTFVPSCSGTKAKTCVNGRQHEWDCAKNSLLQTACKDGLCVPAGKDCDGALNRCAGTKLEVCLDGSWKQFDCSKLGLGPCATKGSSSNCSSL